MSSMTPESPGSDPRWNGSRDTAEARRPCRATARRTGIVGRSPEILDALQVADRIADTDIPVLIVGETGTGKELFARYIHERSGREGRLVCVDCGALPDDLIESLLFGHDRGAFTGAVARSEGLVVQAQGGTLLLDELSSLPLRGQAKLLRVLETRKVRRVGSIHPRDADFRLIATVQDDISETLSDGDFRTDLLQRVTGMMLRLPRLDDRRGDIPLLARHFAEQQGLSITPEAEGLLERHDWPGNVRELRWTLARSAVFAQTGEIDRQVVKRALACGPRSLLSRNGSDEDGERRTRLRAACRAHDGEADAVAETLGIGRSTLYRWLKELGMELKDFRDRRAG